MTDFAEKPVVDRTPAAGRIYDLGYRPYEGERLSRVHAFSSLWVYSVKSVFGIGRSGLNKVFPIGLAVLAFIPAALQLAIAAIAPADLELIRAENYFGYVEVVLALFCAAVAPEIVGRDQKHHTLSLYFSRALSRADYVSAKVAALFAALLLVMLLPQALLLLGGAVATDRVLGYLWDNLGDIPPILGGACLIAGMMTTISLAIACQTPKRALATGVVLAYFAIFTPLGRGLVEATSGEVQRYILLVSPLDVMDGSVFWLFGGRPAPNTPLAMADLSGAACVAALLVYSFVAGAVLYRRFQRLAA